MSDESQAATSSSSCLPRRPLVSDEIRSSLLRKITEEGGFAYVTSVEAAAAAGDLRAAEAAREMAWEQLHSGPWHEVGPAWRDAYAMACLHVASLRAVAGDVKEAMKVLDMGIIMGGPLLRKDLDAALEKITATSVATGWGSEEGGMLAAESSEKLDLQEVSGFEKFNCFLQIFINLYKYR